MGAWHLLQNLSEVYGACGAYSNNGPIVQGIEVSYFKALYIRVIHSYLVNYKINKMLNFWLDSE